MNKRIIINPGERHKDWLVIKEIEQKNYTRYFLCKCMICNKEYEMQMGHLTNKNGNFCCLSCAISKRFEKKADELIGQKFGRLTVIDKHSINKDGNWQYNCRCQCGTEKIIVGYSLKRGNSTSCGCIVKEIAKELGRLKVGDAHHNWQGGITSQNDLDRGKIKETINPIIRERDKYTCQKCGDDKGGNLNVHHIFDFSTYPELKFEPFNLITLCEYCHINDFHSIYPRYNSNTLFDLEDWMETEYKYHNELLEIYSYYHN